MSEAPSPHRQCTRLRMERFGFQSWRRTLCCVLGQDTYLSQCLSLSKCINGYWQIQCGGGGGGGGGLTLQWTSIPFGWELKYSYLKTGYDPWSDRSLRSYVYFTLRYLISNRSGRGTHSSGRQTWSSYVLFHCLVDTSNMWRMLTLHSWNRKDRLNRSVKSLLHWLDVSMRNLNMSVRKSLIWVWFWIR